MCPPGETSYILRNTPVMSRGGRRTSSSMNATTILGDTEDVMTGSGYVKVFFILVKHKADQWFFGQRMEAWT